MLFKHNYLLELVVMFSGTLLFSQAAYCKETIGWVEFVSLQPGDIVLKAKIDSGAKSSSLHCKCQSIYEKNGKKWIILSLKNNSGKKITLKRQVTRMVKIKRHFGDAQRRPVIRLGVCLGNVYKEIDVNIIDRSGLNYQMLIGRNYLAGDFLIDTAVTLTSNPRCGTN
jgi:hypothetical protein